ncbi:MAG: glyoxalase [Deltaproteobacteria bacterium]|nr:MAG: glyoxalase [Deltaproteobacteria bacterium]
MNILPRTGWAFLLALTSLIAGGTRSCISTAHAEPLPLIRAVGCVGLTVSDADRSADFYTRVLSFEKTAEVEQAGEPIEQLEGVFGARTRTVRVRLGRECLDLTEYLAPRGRPAPPDARSNDRSFQHVAIVVSDMDRAYAALRVARVEHASTGPQRLPDWNPNAGGIRAFYFRDPDRHVLEVLQFPRGKGDARWQSADRLFLGVDHTAIVVGDTDVSLAFYRDMLGLHVARTSENWGTEQEHLTNVFGARLRITTLRGATGPGVELLEYLAPRDGRPMPADERANDLIHWQTTLFTSDLGSAARVLRAASVSLSDTRLGYSRAFLARDPDGHVLQLASE